MRSVRVFQFLFRDDTYVPSVQELHGILANLAADIDDDANVAFEDTPSVRRQEVPLGTDQLTHSELRHRS